MRLRARCVPEGQWAGLGKHHEPSPLPATKIEVCPALDRWGPHRDLHRGMDVAVSPVATGHFQQSRVPSGDLQCVPSAGPQSTPHPFPSGWVLSDGIKSWNDMVFGSMVLAV